MQRGAKTLSRSAQTTARDTPYGEKHTGSLHEAATQLRFFSVEGTTQVIKQQRKKNSWK